MIKENDDNRYSWFVSVFAYLPDIHDYWQSSEVKDSTHDGGGSSEELVT